MTTNITPDKARELLCGDFASDAKRELVGNLGVNFDSLTGAYIEGTPGAFALTEAAADLAELVANLRYEYAVQDTETGWYVREDDDGQLSRAAEPQDADWWEDKKACTDYTHWLNNNTEHNYRTVRKLTGDPEHLP